MIIKRLLAFDLLIVIVNCEYFIIHSRQGFSGIIYITGWRTLPDCLWCSLQIMNEMSDKSRLYECELETDHNTQDYVHYSLRKGRGYIVRGFCNISKNVLFIQRCKQRRIVLIRKDNRLQMSLQRQHFLLGYQFKDLEC